MDFDLDRMTEDNNNSDEEDWMDTSWNIVHENSYRGDGDGTEMAADSKSIKTEDENTSLISRMKLNDHKAGMQGLDKDHINHIIFETSKGSRFFENQRRKEEQVQQRIQAQERHRQCITDSELQKAKSEADLLIAELNSSRDLTQTIVHIDMDAFFAAVEMRDDPTLQNKPMAVGGIGMLSTSNYVARKFGVRAAMPGFIGKKLCPELVIVPPNFSRYTEISQQVRQVFAIYDADFCSMSLDEAYLNITDHLKKRPAMSASERSIVRRCQTPADPVLCRCDLNVTIRERVLKGKLKGSENALDLGVENTNGDIMVIQKVKVQEDRCENDPLSPENRISSEDKQTKESSAGEDQSSDMTVKTGSQCPSCGRAISEYEVVTFDVDAESAVQEMRCRIEQQTCLTASAGIAPNMMLAKVCSDQNKPNGQYLLPANLDDVRQFVHDLPIRKVSGIGQVTEQLLGALGISKCSDLFKQRALLYLLYSSVSFSYFMRVACGIGSTQVASTREEERKSMSTERTFSELNQPDELYRKCHELCQSLAKDMKEEQLVGKTISLKLKTTDFQVRTRAQTINAYTNDAETIFAVARGILRAEILAESPKPLCLRLMGVRASKLIAGSECSPGKQDTILGFVKRIPATTCQPIFSKNQKQMTVGLTSEKCRTGLSHVKSDLKCSADLKKSDKEEKRDASLAEYLSGTDNTVFMNIENSVSSDACDKVTQGTVNISIDTGNRETKTDPADQRKERSSSNAAECSFAEDIIETSMTTSADSRIEIQCNKRRSHADMVEAYGRDIKASGSHYGRIDILDDTNASGKADSSHGSSFSSQAASSGNLLCHDAMNNSAESNGQTSNKCSFVREPAFTCPVCCKPVDCINLTDFNNHIDRCLQVDCNYHCHSSQIASVQSSESQQISAGKRPSNSISGSKLKTSPGNRHNLAAMTKRKPAELSPHSSAVKSQASQKCINMNISVDGIKNRTRTPVEKRQSAENLLSTAGSVLSVNSSTHHHSNSDISTTTVNSEFAAQVKVSRFQVDQKQVKDGFAIGSTVQPNSADLDNSDFMVCPLCSAERADWTLETFNQHVDACLNRDTISQILREQQAVEEKPRKRNAGSIQEKNKTHQQVKKTKKSQCIKPEGSILSFFKT